jgi:hypothetical protein
MLSSNLIKSSKSLLSTNATFLNRMLDTRAFSVAYNVKSKFESAFDAKLKASAAQPKKQ